MKQSVNRRKMFRLLLWPIGYSFVAGGLLLWRLGSLAPVGSQEISRCLEARTNNPSYALTNLLSFMDHYSCSPDQAVWMRLPAILLAAIAGGLFVWAIRLWLGRQAAVYGGALFLTSAWFLHIGRYAGASAALLLLVPLVLWLRQAAVRYNMAVWLGFAVAIASGVLVSLPGGIWFGLLLLGLYNQPVIHWLQRQTPARVATLLVTFVASLAPLIYSLISTDTTYRWLNWLGISWQAWQRPLTALADTGVSVRELFWRGPESAPVWLWPLPVLDIVIIVTSLIGFIWLVAVKRGKTAGLMIGLLAISLLLAGFNHYQSVSLSIVVPLFYFFATTGLRYLLGRWGQVFPRNPFARSLAYGIVALVVASAVAYNLRAYFVAWPHNPRVLSSFRAGD